MLKYIQKNSHHVITSGGADATLLYNEPHELIDPSDPMNDVQKKKKKLPSELISSEKHESKMK
jgi:hypothetical protein